MAPSQDACGSSSTSRQDFAVFVDSFATAPSHLGDCVVCGTESLGRKAKNACVPKSHSIARLRSQITPFSVLARNLGTREATWEHNEMPQTGSQRNSWLDM